MNLKMPCDVTRARPTVPDCCLCVYILPYESVSITPQSWDEISKEVTEERSEIEENNNMFFSFFVQSLDTCEVRIGDVE